MLDKLDIKSVDGDNWVAGRGPSANSRGVLILIDMPQFMCATPNDSVNLADNLYQRSSSGYTSDIHIFLTRF